jgi:opacity protein-like surface antigen
MKHLLLAAVAAATLAIAAVPASAQVRFGADPWGTDVQVGPFSFGVGPRYDWRRNGYDPYWRDGYRAYGRECRLVRERFVTPSGRVEFRSHRVCDY